MFPVIYAVVLFSGWAFASGGNPFLLTAAEYMVPTKADRRIYTVTTDVLFGRNITRNGMLVVGGGVSAGYAWGEIMQLEGSFEAGSLRESVYANNAASAGGTGLLRFEPLRTDNLTLGVEALGGIMLYSSPFPAGGRSYNFMGRIGPYVRIRLSDSMALHAFGHWMHVSNGQGLVSYNPSYEAIGGGLGIHWRL